MLRHRQWEARLVAFVTENASRPHDYEQQWDCLLGLAAGVIEAVTGEDLASDHRGQYRSYAGAFRYLQSLGHNSPESLLDSLLEVKPVGFAHRGDLVMAEDGIPMLCMGAYALSIGQEGVHEGLVRVPRAHWVKAWAVGEHHSSWRR